MPGPDPDAVVLRFGPMGVDRLDRLVADAQDALEEDGRAALSVYVALKPDHVEFDAFFKALLPDIPLNGTKNYWRSSVGRLRLASITLYKCESRYHYDAVLPSADEASVRLFIESFDDKRRSP